MNRSSDVGRRLRVLACCALVAVLASACNGVAGTTAATVNGKRISTERVLSLLKDRKQAAALDAQTGTGADLGGPGKDTYNKRAFTDTLNQLVVAELVDRELQRRNLKVTASDLKTARTSLDQSAGAATMKKLPKGMQDFVVRFSASQSVLQKKVSGKAVSKEAQARAQYDQIKASTPEQLSQACVTGAVFSTKTAATTARARLAKGGTVAAAVKGLSPLQVAEQEQCASASGLPASISTLKAGGVSQPLANQGAYVVLRLVRRKTLSFADVRADLEKNLPQPGAAELQAEIGKLAAKAKVTVDDRYGSWNRQAGKVEPPAGTPTTAAPPTTAAVSTTTPSGG